MKGLAGRRVVITGGGSGIGLATAELLIEQGSRVAVIDRDPTASERVDAPVFLADIMDRVALEAAIGAASEALGGLDGLVNNAGGVFGTPGPLETVDFDAFDQTLSINATSMLAATQAAVARFDGPGAIVNVSSLQGTNASPGFYGYGAAKATMIQLTKSLAAELAPRHIRVNAVAPALTLTPAVERGLSAERKAASISAIPLGYPGEAEDIGGVITFLLSASARFVTGQLVIADGGLSLTTARPPRGTIA